MQDEYKTGDQCPIEGYWIQIETRNIAWHTTEGKFPPLPPTMLPKTRAYYKYIGNKESGTDKGYDKDG